MKGMFLAVGALALSACSAGTTYGTGVPQEAQTFKDLYNMFTLKRDRKNIDYSARPDLIVPKDTASLPQPLDSEATTSNPDWPESPDQRIARIRAEAGGINARSGDYSIREQLRKKEGIAITRTSPKGKFVPGKTDKDGNPLLNLGVDENARQKMLEAKASGDYSNGTTRKYLTEPPAAYRIPVDTAPQGKAAFTEEELAQRKLLAEKQKRGYQELKPLAPRND